jgi:carnitine O-acetyltransferase
MNMTVANLVSPAISPVSKKSSLPADPSGGETFKFQDKLPKLPIPELEITAKKYLGVLEPLQVNLKNFDIQGIFFKLW